MSEVPDYAEFHEKYARKLAAAPEATRNLARTLHRIAFEGVSPDGSGDRMMGAFRPAPLYLDQAIAIVGGWAPRLIDAIAAAIPKQ